VKNSTPPEAEANRPLGIGFLQAVKRGKGKCGKPFRRDPAVTKARSQTKHRYTIVTSHPKGRTTDDVGGGRGEKSKVGIKRFRRPSEMPAKNI
jgi:hypothetical protein